MSGESDYSEKTARVENFLNQKDASLGIPAGIPEHIPTSMQRWLAMPPEELQKQSPEDIALGAITLRQSAFFLQKEQNRLQTLLTRHCESIDKLLAKEVVCKPGYTREERLRQAIQDSDEATIMDKARHQTLLQLERIKWLVTRLDSLATALLSLLQSKRNIYE